MASHYYLNPSPATNVSVLTTLMPFIRVDPFTGVSVVLKNLDATSTVTLLVDPSVGGEAPNIERRYTARAAPGEECSVELTPPMFARFIRVAAQTDGPSYPVVQVSWSIIGKTPQTP